MPLLPLWLMPTLLWKHLSGGAGRAGRPFGRWPLREGNHLSSTICLGAPSTHDVSGMGRNLLQNGGHEPALKGKDGFKDILFFFKDFLFLIIEIQTWNQVQSQFILTPGVICLARWFLGKKNSVNSVKEAIILMYWQWWPKSEVYLYIHPIFSRLKASHKTMKRQTPHNPCMVTSNRQALSRINTFWIFFRRTPAKQSLLSLSKQPPCERTWVKAQWEASPLIEPQPSPSRGSLYWSTS